MLLISCGTTKKIEYVSVVAAEDIPEFPELEYYGESENGMYVTVDSLWFQRVAKYKLEMDELRIVLKRIEELNQVRQ